MHYVIGDVHGCYDEMINLIKQIEDKDELAQITFVGDFIDRGTKVWDVLQWMISHITDDGKYQSVRGNHEDMIISWFKDWMVWWNEGGFSHPKLKLMPETHYDFSKWLDAVGYLTPDTIGPVVQFFEDLPLRKMIDIQTTEGTMTFEIVHSWDFIDEDLEESTRKHINLYSRGFSNNKNSDITIIHGHTPTLKKILYEENSINVDGGCCYKSDTYPYDCCLCGICLETGEEFYA